MIFEDIGHSFGCVKTDTGKIKTSDSDSRLCSAKVSFFVRFVLFRDAGFSFQNFGGQIFIPDNMISVVRQYDGTVKSISG